MAPAIFTTDYEARLAVCIPPNATERSFIANGIIQDLMGGIIRDDLFVFGVYGETNNHVVVSQK